ncbi:ribose-phosphate diphosphokinase [Devosia sp.]|uniref:ribose-phosphate diphosphokinase n=1 Tax=Devosia sp. TaxID=1871048 RepID=UPI002EE95A82
MRLFALEGTHVLGRAVAAAIGTDLAPLEEREFSDGEHKSRPLMSVRNEDVYVLHSLHGGGAQSPADRLVRLLFFLAACRDNGAARLTAVVPYLAFSRKDQQTKPRDPVTTRYVAELLEAVGTDAVVTMEVHNVAAFQNAFRCRNVHLDTQHLFTTAVVARSAGRPVVFLAPDSGGMRRVQALRETFIAETGRAAGLAIMEKRRSEDVVSGNLFAGEVAGADVFILDDMIASGGTVLRAARAARERGAARVFALAAHGLFAGGSAALFGGTDVDAILVTDSIPLPEGLDTGGRLEIVGCAGLIGEAIERLHAGGSIHRLLNPRP